MCLYNHKLNGAGDELTGKRFIQLLCCKMISQAKTICQIKGSFLALPHATRSASALRGVEGVTIRTGSKNIMVRLSGVSGSFTMAGHVIVVLGIITSIIKG